MPYVDIVAPEQRTTVPLADKLALRSDCEDEQAELELHSIYGMYIG